LLTIIQAAADELGTNSVPSAVFGNNSTDGRRYRRFAHAIGKWLVRNGDWQELRTESTFTSVATETQTSMVPSDLDHFVDETFWNRSRRLAFYGPVGPQEWQAIKGGLTSSPVTNTFAYRGTNILLSPVPSAGDTYAFEYISNKFCESSGGTAQASWAADTDLPRLDDELFILGIVWMWKQSNEMPWQADYEKFEDYRKTCLMQDKPRRVLNMSSNRRRPPGIVVPDGDWTP
jgi:hypothetical protein